MIVKVMVWCCGGGSVSDCDGDGVVSGSINDWCCAWFRS